MQSDTAPIRPHGVQRFALPASGAASVAAVQPAGSNRLYLIDASAVTAPVWLANAFRTAGTPLRPTAGRQTGYHYAAVADGQSGPVEPAWPTIAGATVVDGSMTLTARPAPVAGEDVISVATWTQVDPPDDALTITDIDVDGVLTSALIGGGTSGLVYVVEVLIAMSSSATYPATLSLTVM